MANDFKLCVRVNLNGHKTCNDFGCIRSKVIATQLLEYFFLSRQFTVGNSLQILTGYTPDL